MKRGYSFMVFTQPEGKSHRFFLSSRAAKVSAVLAIIILTGFAAMFFFFAAYHRLSRRVSFLEGENQRLSQENLKIHELSRRMAELESVRRRLAAMLGVNESYHDSLAVTYPAAKPGVSSFATGTGPLEDRLKPRGKPVEGIISRGYSTVHPGLDIAAKTDAPVVATADGIVTDVGYDETYGNFVVIDHGGDFQTFYAHLSRSIVQKDQGISRGDILGFVGTTGRSTGPHLHYEVRRGETRLNPVLYLY